MRKLFAAAVLVALASGCSGSETVCRVSADCASGRCRTDGTCAPVSGSNSGSSGSGSSSGASSGSSGSSGTSAGSSSGGSGGCIPTGGDTIPRDEVPLQAGLHATFRIAVDAGFDTAGAALPDGGTFWDMTSALQGDQNVRVDLESLSGQWFAGDFAGATYASQLTEGSDLLGIFEVTDDALLLRGVASPTSGFGQTELTYDPPVTVLAFPLFPSATWSTTSTVSGQAEGVFSTYFETYDSEIDAEGTLATPYATFPVRRVNTELTRTVGGLVVTQRTFLFVTACFGTVAAVTSTYDEPQAEFSHASEVRRLAP